MTNETKPKGPGGRPSLYRPEYCERVLEFGREGMSVVEMAAEIGVSRNALEERWPEAHEEFREAFARARELSQAWWERQGRVGLTAERFNAQVYSRSMAARFPKDWRESKEQRVTGADGGAVQIESGLAPELMQELADLVIKTPEGK
jgi:hypothetical protein